MTSDADELENEQHRSRMRELQQQQADESRRRSMRRRSMSWPRLAMPPHGSAPSAGTRSGMQRVEPAFEAEIRVRKASSSEQWR